MLQPALALQRLRSAARVMYGATVRYWEIIADNLSKAGFSWGCVSAIDSNGRTIWIADAHRDDGKRFVASTGKSDSMSNDLRASPLSSSGRRAGRFSDFGVGASVRRSGEIWRRSRKPPCRTNAYGRLSIYQ